MRRSQLLSGMAVAVAATASAAGDGPPQEVAPPQSPPPSAESAPPEQGRKGVEVLPEGTLDHKGKPLPFVKRLKRAPGWTRRKERRQIALNRTEARAASHAKEKQRRPARDARKG